MHGHPPETLGLLPNLPPHSCTAEDSTTRPHPLVEPLGSLYSYASPQALLGTALTASSQLSCAPDSALTSHSTPVRCSCSTSAGPGPGYPQLAHLLAGGDDLPYGIDEATLVVGDEAHEDLLLRRVQEHEHAHLARGCMWEVHAAGLWAETLQKLPTIGTPG